MSGANRIPHTRVSVKFINDKSSCSRNLIDHLTPEVSDGYVCFLHARGAAGRHGDRYITQRAEWIGGGAGQGDRFTTQLACFFRRAQNVFRLAARADCDQHVARLRQSRNLTRKYFFVAQIVADGSKC